MTNRASRPKFWSSLFRKQPIEPGVADPLEEDIARVRAGFERASANLSDSVNALLDDLERRQKRRRGNPDA
jgi:hypothetical protein